MVCDMPKPCKVPSVDSCQKRFLWALKEVDLSPHPSVGLVLQVGDSEKFPHALVLKAWILSWSRFHMHRGGWRFVELGLACKADDVIVTLLLQVWDLSTQDSWSSIACKVTMIGHRDTVRCLQVDDDKVISGSYDMMLKIWDLRTGQCRKTLS